MWIQATRYTAAGAVGTAVHYATLIGLVRFADTGYLAATTLGATLGALMNYALNYRLTFSSSRPHRAALPKFSIVALSGIAINSVVMLGMVGGFGVHYIVAQVIATAVVLTWGFLINRAWTF